MNAKGLIHAACVDERKRLSSNKLDENFVQSEHFCFPPNYFFIFTSFMIFGVILKSKNWGFLGPDLSVTLAQFCVIDSI